MRKISIFSFLLFFGFGLFAQGDGPRAMLLLPKKLNMITPAYLRLSSNFNFAQDILIDGADITSNVVPVTYNRYLKVNGRFAQIQAYPIWGNIEGEIVRDDQSLNVPSTSGLGDPYVGFRIGLLNTPALSMEEFKKYKQKFQLYALFGMSIPLGEYNQNSPVNLGTNRWAFRLAVPMVLPFGRNPARNFFLEMTPNLMLYSKNNAPFGGTSRTQSPLFIFETHLSHNFVKFFWLSADLRYQLGGQTKTDDVKDNNQINQLGGGLTAGFVIVAPLGLQLSYGSVLISEKSKGQMLRIRLTFVF